MPELKSETSVTIDDQEETDGVSSGSGRSSVRQRNGDIDFGLLTTFVGYQLRKAYGRLFQTFNEMLKELGLAPGQYSVMMLVSLNPGLSQMALAEATGIDRSTAVPIVNRFVKRGWVRRTRRRDDRRFYSLRLTEAGEAILARARPIIEEHEERLLGGLSKAERQTLVDLLARIASPNPSA